MANRKSAHSSTLLNVHTMNGILNIDKPAGWTSHDVVAWVRRVLREKRVGHAGTLDPMATGVLLVCVGQATRVVEYLTAGQKVYRAEAQLGVTTDTYDADGEVIGHRTRPAADRRRPAQTRWRASWARSSSARRPTRRSNRTARRPIARRARRDRGAAGPTGDDPRHRAAGLGPDGLEAHHRSHLRPRHLHPQPDPRPGTSSGMWRRAHPPDPHPQRPVHA